MSDMKVLKYNYIINCIIVAVVILVASSCSKDKSGDSGSNNLTKQRLVSELSVESDDGDWRVIMVLYYDNRNRVNRLQYQEFEDGDSYTDFYDVYYYDNVVEYVSSYGSLYAELNNEGYVEIIEDDDDDLTICRYDSSGHIISASTNYESSSYISRFEWNSGNIIAITDAGGSDGDYYMSATLQSDNHNHNLINIDINQFILTEVCGAEYEGHFWYLWPLDLHGKKMSNYVTSYKEVSKYGSYDNAMRWTFDGGYPVKCDVTEIGDGYSREYKYTVRIKYKN